LPENPLLPHRKLRELHTLMLRTRDLERKQKSTSAREALLAATTMQLLPGDLLSSRTNDLTAAQLAPTGKKRNPTDKKPRTSGTLPPIANIPSRLALCAAAAKALQAAGTDGLVLSFTQQAAAEPGWLAALEWAQTAMLPLILVCTDPTAGLPSRSTKAKPSDPILDFATINRLAARTKLAVLTVDGEDAVAVYRVMQESVLRARNGLGPAVIWAIMSPAKPKPSAQPIARLEAYLAARKIPFKS
jgi:TPP-dependent pyruvate/acetoin dehydrogenase alpha subunit